MVSDTFPNFSNDFRLLSSPTPSRRTRILLSPINAPAPLSSINVPAPLSSINVPAPLSPINVPAPLTMLSSSLDRPLHVDALFEWQSQMSRVLHDTASRESFSLSAPTPRDAALAFWSHAIAMCSQDPVTGVPPGVYVNNFTDRGLMSRNRSFYMCVFVYFITHICSS
jgi:hypothetical protein